MCFADNNLGAKLLCFEEKDIIKYLFAENIGIVSGKRRCYWKAN
jgi:phosphoribosylformylglycinamidine synthase